MRRIILSVLILPLMVLAAMAKPAAPYRDPALAHITFGLFCAITTTGQTDAPGTTSGWIHTTQDAPAFHWPGQRTVPAVLGLAFGVRAQTQPGIAFPDAEMRVYRPGTERPDIWSSPMSDTGPALAFFRFDTDAERIPGLWVLEAWSGPTRLYRVEFDVVPATTGNPIAQACGGTA